MDTKRLITAIGLGLGLIVIYFAVLNWMDSKNVWHLPPAPPPSAAVTPPTQPAGSPSSQTVAESMPPTTGPGSLPPNISATTGPIASIHVVPATQPNLNPVPSLLGSEKPKDSQFAMQADVQSFGAGLASVILNDFKKTTQGKDPYLFELPLPGRLDTEPLGSRSITVDGVTYDLAGVKWSLIHSAPTEVTYGADLVSNGSTLLSITKNFRMSPRSEPNEGFEIQVEYNLVNATGKPLKVHLEFNGPTLPPPETNRPPDRQVVGGYIVDKDNNLEVTQHPIEEFKPDKNNGEIDLTKDSKGRPARWAGAVSNYFGAVVLPLDMRVNGNPTNPDYIASIIAHGVNIDKEVPMEDHRAYLTFQTTDINLEPGKPVTLPMSVYLGPKWRKTLDTAYYAVYPRKYDLLGIIRSSMCGISFCTFGWLTTVIVWLLGVLHDFIFRDWGLAIIGLVAIVRVCLHPITRRSQISMSKMSKMGPEMERLRKKYADDKEALNKAMVEFHREQGLGPYLGCLPMFLQMPIWIALYGVLQSTFELRQAPFLWNLTWIHDLSQPDYLLKFPHAIHVFFFDLHGINVLPVLLSAVMFIQQQFMPKPVAATPEQMQQQKMMQWLSPAMFLFFFYNLPSGLNLYIFTSTSVGIIESKVVRDHLKAREEAEKAGRVFIPTKATRGNKQSDLRQKDEPPKRRGFLGWLGALWGKLLEKAEEIRRQQDDDDKGNNKRK